MVDAPIDAVDDEADPIAQLIGQFLSEITKRPSTSS
jgi:hypothetical protein